MDTQQAEYQEIKVSPPKSKRHKQAALCESARHQTCTFDPREADTVRDSGRSIYFTDILAGQGYV